MQNIKYSGNAFQIRNGNKYSWNKLENVFWFIFFAEPWYECKLCLKGNEVVYDLVS